MDAAVLTKQAADKPPQDYDDEENTSCLTSTEYLKTLLDEQGRGERGLPAVGACSSARTRTKALQQAVAAAGSLRSLQYP